jgi:hypothetical protein
VYNPKFKNCNSRHVHELAMEQASANLMMKSLMSSRRLMVQNPAPRIISKTSEQWRVLFARFDWLYDSEHLLSGIQDPSRYKPPFDLSDSVATVKFSRVLGFYLRRVNL